LQVIDTNALTREQWLALRRQSIGASDAPVIAGLSKYKTRFGLWLEKTGQSEPEEAGEEARWGLRLEDDIEDAMRVERGINIVTRQRMVASSEFPWLTATVDAMDADGQFWELKATSKYVAEGEPVGDDWLIQCHQQMFCCDQNYWNIAAFVGPRLKLATWQIKRDPQVWASYFDLASEFQQHIEDRTPPAEFDAADAQLLLKYYRDVEPVELELPPALVIAAGQYDVECEIIRQAEANRDKAKAQLLAAMGTAAAARCGPYLMRRIQVNVKAQPPKPKAAYSYTKFTFTDTRKED
jgi:putative phage-type endonuclease